MQEKKSSALWVATAMLLLAVALPSAYVTSYFALSEVKDENIATSPDGAEYRRPLRWRVYTRDWQRTIFKPFGFVESTVTELELSILSESDVSRP